MGGKKEIMSGETSTTTTQLRYVLWLYSKWNSYPMKPLIFRSYVVSRLGCAGPYTLVDSYTIVLAPN